MKQNIKDAFKAFSIELPLYGGLVAVYAFVVLHFLGQRLTQLFHTERKLYAVTSLVLIVGQGLFLEILSRALLGLVKGKREK